MYPGETNIRRLRIQAFVALMSPRGTNGSKFTLAAAGYDFDRGPNEYLGPSGDVGIHCSLYLYIFVLVLRGPCGGGVRLITRVLAEVAPRIA